MRTTLDIDDDVLQAAKELARAEKKTAGQVLSELARKGLTAPAGFAESADERHGFLFKNGWYVLPSRGGIVTNELIAEIEEQLDLEDAGLAGREPSSGSDG